MKRVLPAALVLPLLALPLLAACHVMSLEEARAECAKQGGFLVVIYSQKITVAGVGQEIAKPGDCVPSKDLDLRAPAPAPAN